MQHRGDIRSVLASYADAWRAGDVERVLDAYHEDFELHYFGRNSLAGRHVGRDAALVALSEATARTDRELIEVVDVLHGERLGALVVVEALGSGAGRREVQRVLLYRVEEGRLRECRLYDEDQAFIDSLWGGGNISTP